MGKVSIAEAKARLSEIIDKAAHGEEIIITRRGTPVARVTAVATPRAPIDFHRVDAFRSSLKLDRKGSTALIRRMRDDRY